jgi:hypothetical protein
VLQRHFSSLGWHCDVVAPSSIPRLVGERIKTDRGDAMKVARRVMKNKTVVAVARELAGLVWAIAREVQTSGWQASRQSRPTPATGGRTTSL